MYFARDSRALAFPHRRLTVGALGVEAIRAHSARCWTTRTCQNWRSLFSTARQGVGTTRWRLVSSPRGARGRPASPARCFGEVLTMLKTFFCPFAFGEYDMAMHEASTRLKLNTRLVPHRLRRNDASADALAGIQEGEIQTRGRWQSPEMVWRV